MNMRLLKKNFNIIRTINTSGNIVPKCRDCKNYIKHVENNIEYESLGKCKKNGYNLKHESYYFNSSACRKSEIFCGDSGKFFENKKL
jgi:hypothetical protein